MQTIRAIPGKPLDIGISGENKARRIRFDLVEKWRVEYDGQGSADLLVQRNGDETPYPVVLNTDSDGVTAWVVTASDTDRPGQGKAELQYRVGDVLVKSSVYTFFVKPALESAEEGTAPEPQENWVAQVLQAADEVREAAGREIRAEASTLPPGVPATAEVSASGQTAVFHFGIPTGPQGEPGRAGTDGTGIQSIEQTASVEDAGTNLITLSLTDGSSHVFQILNGSAGTDGRDGQDGYTPVKNVDYFDGQDGATFTPKVSECGVLSWTNDRGLDNPEPVNIKGEQGTPGTNGSNGQNGATFTPAISSDGILSWTNNGGLVNPANTDFPALLTQVLSASDFLTALMERTTPGERHRTFFGGRNLGTGVTDAQKAAIQDGTFRGLLTGDYWVINNVTWRIVDMDYWYNTGDTAFTRHHLVIMPDSTLTDAAMNDTDTTAGGYAGSKFYTDTMPSVKATCEAAFPSMVLTYREYLVNAVTNGRPSGGNWADCSVELPSEIMMYGTRIFSPANDGTTIATLFTVSRQQLALFQMVPRFGFVKNRWCWLRDPISDAYFARVGYYGRAHYGGASRPQGIRPVFPIG